MNADAMKEYLVELGFNVDNVAYTKFKRTLDDVTSQIARHTEGMSKGYALAAVKVVGVLAAIGTATYGLLDKIAQTDIGYKNFARDMLLGEEQGRKFKIVTDMMGKSLKDIAWDDETRQRYTSLMKDLSDVGRGEGVSKTLKGVRDLSHEWMRFKVLSVPFMEKIAESVIKNLVGPMGSAKQSAKELNDAFKKNMGEIAEKVGSALAEIILHGMAVVRVVRDIYGVFEKMWKSMSEGQKWTVGLSAALTVLWKIWKMSPVGRFITIITVAIGLVKDFYAWLDGRKSNPVLAPIWEKIIWVLNKIIAFARKLGLEISDIEQKAPQPETAPGTTTPPTGTGAGAVAPGAGVSQPYAVATQPGEGTSSWTKGMVGPVRPGTGEGAGGTEQTSGFMASIAKVESGHVKGDPYKVHGKWLYNKKTGRWDRAVGKYQIMESNWASWAKAAGLSPDAPHTEENQEIVARHRMGIYLRQFRGNEQLAAIAWHAGPGRAEQVAKGDYRPLSYSDTIMKTAQYVQRVTGSTYAKAGAGGAGGDAGMTQNISTVNVNVTQPGATAKDIKNAFDEAGKKQAQMQIRYARGRG